MAHDDRGISKSTKAVKLFVNTYWYLAIAAACVVGTLLILTSLGIGTPLGDYVVLPIQVTYSDTVGAGLSAQTLEATNVLVTGSDRVLVKFTQRGARFLHGFVVGLTFTLGMFWIAWQLRSFLKEVRSGRPFSAENTHRIRRIGYLVTVGGPAYGLATYLLAWRYVDRISIPGATLSLSMSWHWELVFLGLVIIVIAQILEAGCRLQEEADLTV
jgi:hypothetical protein